MAPLDQGECQRNRNGVHQEQNSGGGRQTHGQMQSEGLHPRRMKDLLGNRNCERHGADIEQNLCGTRGAGPLPEKLDEDQQRAHHDCLGGRKFDQPK